MVFMGVTNENERKFAQFRAKAMPRTDEVSISNTKEPLSPLVINSSRPNSLFSDLDSIFDKQTKANSHEVIGSLYLVLM